MLASELARRLSVSPSTVTNWATKYHPPLAFELDQGRRWFSLDGYSRFAETHSKLRGVARQAMKSPRETLPTTITSQQSLLEVRERLQKLLEQIDAVHEGSDQAKKSAAKLKREVAATLKLLPGTTVADGTE
jgi:transposase-like protein